LRSAHHKIKEIFLIFLGALAIYFLVSLFSYSSEDPGWSFVGIHKNINNAGGIVGAYISDIFFYLCGVFAFWIPIGSLYGVYLSYRNSLFIENSRYLSLFIKIVGFIFILVSGCALTSMYIKNPYLIISDYPNGPGGLIGKLSASMLIGNFNKVGATIFATSIFLVGIVLFTGASIITAANVLLKYITDAYYFIVNFISKYFSLILVKSKKSFRSNLDSFRKYLDERKLNKEKIKSEKLEKSKKAKELKQELKEKRKLEKQIKKTEEVKNKEIKNTEIAKIEISAPIKIQKTENNDNWDEINSEAETLKDVFTNNKIDHSALKLEKVSRKVVKGSGSLPGINLLDTPNLEDKVGYTEQQLQDMATLVESKLLDFGLKVQVVEVSPGPVIVRLELMLAPGTKVSKLTTISKDIARSLSIESVRVVEVIPGKPYVGIEIPNQHRETVFLSEVLRSQEYQKSKSPITLVLGKDISGNTAVADLSKIPHLLVAGTTGSGKSVGINAMILSILFKSSPKDVRLIMIDPKMLELAIYEGIPHLLTPVVTDMKDAANVLRWCVAEMENRYRLMAALGVRNIIGFNQKIEKALKDNNPICDPLWPEEATDPPPQLEKLPYIVVIVDEFADMIMVVGKKVEELIARIAQKARAAGIHMILATQRPSVDVITGLIKANVPTRIAFQVSSKIDSRTILDQQGAENLLGQGDMLFLPPGTGIPNRVHGAFVADHEVHNVVDKLKQDGEPDYVPEILNKVTVPGLPKLDIDGEDDTEADELYDEAVQFVLENKKTSISALQRRFKIGYNRAARIIEHMEEVGVLSPVQANGLREILITDGVG